jgi:hypothetical protein
MCVTFAQLSSGGGSSVDSGGSSGSTGGSASITSGGSNPSLGGSSTAGGSSPQTGGSPPISGGSMATGGSSQATGGSSTTVQSLYTVTKVSSGTYPSTEGIVRITTDSTSIYWTSYYSTSSTAHMGTIKKMPKVGGPSTTLITTSGSTPTDLLIRNGQIYWMEMLDGTLTTNINRTPVTGGSSITLTAATSTSSTQTIPQYLKSDGQYLYWIGTSLVRSDIGYATDVQTIVNSMSINGGAVTTIQTLGSSGTPFPTWAVTDGDTDRICYTIVWNSTYKADSQWLSSTYPGLYCVNKSSISNGTNLAIVSSQLPTLDKFSCPTAYAAGHVFWVNQYGIANDSGYLSQETEYLPSSTINCNSVTSMTGDSTSLFYTNQNGGGVDLHQVNLMDKSDKILTSTSAFTYMKSDDSSLFWVDQSLSSINRISEY